MIPPGFAADLAAGDASVQVLVDGTNSNIATVALGYAEADRLGARRLAGAARGGAGLVPPVDLRDRAWYNPDLASRDYNVPGGGRRAPLLVCLLLTSLAVVRERELGTLEQLMVSPLRRSS